MQVLSDFIHLMLDRRVSLVSKLLFFALVGIYILLPIDLIPDFLLPLGVVDDGGLIVAAVVGFTRHARKQVALDFAAAAPNGDVTVLPPDVQPAAGGDTALAQSKHAGPAPTSQVFIHRDSRGSGLSCGCLALIGLLFVSPFIGFAILTLSSGLALSGLFAPVFDLIDPPASVNLVSSRTIVNSLRGLGQLVTVRGEFSQTDLKVSVHEGILNSGYHSANHVALGRIEAGVDITQFDRDDVRYDAATGAIHLTLPPPIITNCNIEHIDQDDYSLSVLQKDWDAVRQLAEYEAIAQFREDALEGGILAESKEEITHRLGTFINTLTGSPVHIEFEDPGEAQYGDTCLPDLPTGWQIDAETGEWTRAS